jgi:hypothetical protein
VEQFEGKRSYYSCMPPMLISGVLQRLGLRQCVFQRAQGNVEIYSVFISTLLVHVAAMRGKLKG